MYKFGWFSTGRGEGAKKLLETAHNSIKSGGIKGSISFVFCSREPGEYTETDTFIEQVKSYGIPIICFSYQKYKAEHENDDVDDEGFPLWRLSYDREVMKRISGYEADLCLLVGYMLIVGKEMCVKYNMLNIHPALPEGPKGTWREVIWELIGNEAKETGAMMHLVTPELDRGPVVAYYKFPLKSKPFDKLWKYNKDKNVSEIKNTDGENNELFKTIRKYGLLREHPLVLCTMEAFSSGKLYINNGTICRNDGTIVNGYDLSETIERYIDNIS